MPILTRLFVGTNSTWDRLHDLQAGFPGDNVTSSGVLEDNGRFCEVLNGTEVEGFGVFVAPRMPDPELELEDADEAQPRLK